MTELLIWIKQNDAEIGHWVLIGEVGVIAFWLTWKFLSIEDRLRRLEAPRNPSAEKNDDSIRELAH